MISRVYDLRQELLKKDAGFRLTAIAGWKPVTTGRSPSLRIGISRAWTAGPDFS